MKENRVYNKIPGESGMVLLQQKLGGALKEDYTKKAKENYASKSGKEPESPLQQKLGWNVCKLLTLATKAGEEPENSCKSWGEHGVHRFLCVSASTPATYIVLALDITQSQLHSMYISLYVTVVIEHYF